MKVRFLKPAQSEVDDAVEWYNSQSGSLGTQFLDDLDRTIRRIVAYIILNSPWLSYNNK
jgi:hypothetical protein